MAPKEKGDPAGGRQIPLSVCQDNTEFKAQLHDLQHLLQVSRITRRCAVSAAAAKMLAPMVFGTGEGIR